jgi:hypothetical protein
MTAALPTLFGGMTSDFFAEVEDRPTVTNTIAAATSAAAATPSLPLTATPPESGRGGSRVGITIHQHLKPP